MNTIKVVDDDPSRNRQAVKNSKVKLNGVRAGMIAGTDVFVL